MTDLLCENCNREIYENSDSLNDYLDNIQKEIDNNIFKKIISNNNDLCDVNKILNDYIIIHDKKFIVYYIRCIFNISFDDDNDNHDLYTTYEHKNEIYKIDNQLQYFIDVMKLSRDKIFNKINQITIIIVNDKCFMTDEYSRYMRKSSIERRINQISSRYPNILKNNILIRHKSQLIFNI